MQSQCDFNARTFLKYANWMSSMAAWASSMSTDFESRHFAWAVERRIMVSKVRAVTGVVYKNRTKWWKIYNHAHLLTIYNVQVNDVELWSNSLMSLENISGTNGSMNRYQRLTNFPTFRFIIRIHVEPDWQEIVMKYKLITLAMLSFCMLSWLRNLAYSSAMYSAASLVRLGFSAFATWIYFLMNCMLTILKLRRQNLISNVRYTYL